MDSYDSSSDAQDFSFDDALLELSEHGIDFSFDSESELADLMHEGFDGLPGQEFAKPIVAVKEYFSCTADIQEITKQIATQTEHNGMQIEWIPAKDGYLILPKDQIRATNLYMLFSHDTQIMQVGMFLDHFAFSIRSKQRAIEYSLDDDPLPFKPYYAENLAYIDHLTHEVHCQMKFPSIRDTCDFLVKITQIPRARLGSYNFVLPLIVCENKENPASEAEDVMKLLLEMQKARQMMELVWENPPKFNFGFYTGEKQWRWYIMRRTGDNTVFARKMFLGKVTNWSERLYMATFVSRLLHYIKQQLFAVRVGSVQRQEAILAQFREHAKPSTKIPQMRTRGSSN